MPEIPAYTYTGAHFAATSGGYWVIVLTGSGTLTLTKGAHTVEAFLLGGGGGGGGGGCRTEQTVSLAKGTAYPVVIGAGGTAGQMDRPDIQLYASNGGSGGATSAFGLIAAGGTGGAVSRTGGAGGADGGTGGDGEWWKDINRNGTAGGTGTLVFGTAFESVDYVGGGGGGGGSAGDEQSGGNAGAGGSGGGGAGGRGCYQEHGWGGSNATSYGAGGGGGGAGGGWNEKNQVYAGGGGGAGSPGLVAIRGTSADPTDIPVEYNGVRLTGLVYNGTPVTGLVYNGQRIF